MIAPPKPQEHEELEALIKEARERQLRRRLLGAAAVAIAAALALGIYAVTFAGNPSRTAGSNAQHGGGSICRSSELSASAEFNGLAGSLSGSVMIWDTSHSSCSLPRTRPVVLISSPGKQIAIKETVVKPLNPNDVPRLAGGAMAEVYLEWANWCGKEPTSLTLRFGQQLQVTAPLVNTNPGCMDESTATPSTIEVSRLLT
jgi:hypothetical protein